MSDTDAATNGLPTGAGPASPSLGEFGLDEAAGASGSWRRLTKGRAADALLGQGTALGHGRMVAGVGGVPVA